MRTTINLQEDAAIAARHVARREKLSLGDAISELIRRGASVGQPLVKEPATPPMKGRWALLPARDEIITPEHVRDVMEREGI
jgi:hypothetical protein